VLAFFYLKSFLKASPKLFQNNRSRATTLHSTPLRDHFCNIQSSSESYGPAVLIIEPLCTITTFRKRALYVEYWLSSGQVISLFLRAFKDCIVSKVTLILHQMMARDMVCLK